MKYYLIVNCLFWCSAAFANANQKSEVLFKEYSISNELSEEHKRALTTKVCFKLPNSFQYAKNILSNDSISIYVQDVGVLGAYKRLDADISKEKIEIANQRAEQLPNSRKIIEYHKLYFGEFYGALIVNQSNSDQSYSCELIVSNDYYGFHIISNTTKDFRNIAIAKRALLSFVYDENADISNDYMRFEFNVKKLNLIHLTKGNENQFVFASDTVGSQEPTVFIRVLQTQSFEEGALNNLEQMATNLYEQGERINPQEIRNQGDTSVNGMRGYFIESTYKTDLSHNYRHLTVLTDSQYIFFIDGTSLISKKNTKKDLIEVIHSFKRKN